MPQLCTGFNEEKVVLLSLFFTLLCCDLSLLVQIRLVSDKNNDNIVTTFSAYIIDPFPSVLEGLLIWKWIRLLPTLS